MDATNKRSKRAPICGILPFLGKHMRLLRLGLRNGSGTMFRHLSLRSTFPIIQRTVHVSGHNGLELLGAKSDKIQESKRSPYGRSKISVADFMDDTSQVPKFMKKFQEFDVLRDAIKKSNSILEILTIIRLNKDTMEAPQINTAVSCLTRLRHAEKGTSSMQSDEEILTNPEFQLLCKIIVQRIRSLSTQHLISCLLFVDTFNVSIKTTIAQSVLQLIRQRINDFEVSQICFLHATLERIKESHSVEDGLLNAVILALPMVFEIKVANNLLDFTNTTTVVSCIRFGVYHKLRAEILNKLIDAAEANKNSLNSYECFHLKESLKEEKLSHLGVKEDVVKSLLEFTENGAKIWEMKTEKELIP